MTLDSIQLLTAMVVGIGATLVMDLWNLFLKRTFAVPSLNYCWLGRWISHMAVGTFRHASIAAAPRRPFECAVGWAGHYSIGVVFALVLALLTSGDWLVQPTLPLALFFGIATVVFPFFVLQPAIGLGVAASRAPEPAKARLKSLATHTAFGVGLYLSALAVGYWLRNSAG